MENLQKEFLPNRIGKRRSIVIMAVAGFFIAGLVGLFYWQITKNQIYVDKSEIFADTISLSSSQGGMLKEVFVKEGDTVPADFAVARVGDDLVKTATKGLVVQTNNNIGENLSPGEAVVKIINPDNLKVVASIEEDKGLSDVAVGQQVVFTVDAFGAKKFYGIVDEVSPISRVMDVVFNISDQRQENEFDIKIRFDQSQYPELKNGMSAKVWILKK